MQSDKGYGMKLSRLSPTVGMNLRTDGCILLFCDKGRMVVSLDFERQIIRQGNIVILFADTYMNVERVSQQSSIQFMEISSILFDEATFAHAISLWDYLSYNPILYPDSEQRKLLDLWIKQLEWIISIPSAKHARAMLRNHIGNFFIGLEAALQASIGDLKAKDTNLTRQTINKFFRLVVEHCHKQHNVRFYADLLCITPYYLSKITRKAVNASPKDLIDMQIIAEIKHMLLSSELSVKEIAQKFHFETISYLQRYFKRHTGMTPTEFRKSNFS